MKFKLTETTAATERVNVTYPRQNRISWTFVSFQVVQRGGSPSCSQECQIFLTFPLLEMAFLTKRRRSRCCERSICFLIKIRDNATRGPSASENKENSQGKTRLVFELTDKKGCYVPIVTIHIRDNSSIFDRKGVTRGTLE